MSGYVLVIYKSGAKVEIACEGFVVRKHGGAIVEVEWTKPNPRPLHLGVDEIVAVYDYSGDPA